MTYFEKKLMQGLLNYYKDMIFFKSKIFQEYSRIFFPKIVKKQVGVAHVILFAPLLLSTLYINVFLNRLICISCMLYVTFHVDWSLLKVCSLSKKGINNNNNCSLLSQP
jgi:hypothetical protein